MSSSVYNRLKRRTQKRAAVGLLLTTVLCVSTSGRIARTTEQHSLAQHSLVQRSLVQHPLGSSCALQTTTGQHEGVIKRSSTGIRTCMAPEQGDFCLPPADIMTVALVYTYQFDEKGMLSCLPTQPRLAPGLA